MSDRDQVPQLLQEASNAALLQSAQMRAAQLLLAYDGEVYPQDGCAITLSVMLQAAGILVPNTFTAFGLGQLLESKRGWKLVAIGQQQPGDVGSTCGAEPQHGVDHIYLVLKVVNPDEMLVADNQRAYVHSRSVTGKPDGKSPTRFFLRAS